MLVAPMVLIVIYCRNRDMSFNLDPSEMAVELFLVRFDGLSRRLPGPSFI